MAYLECNYFSFTLKHNVIIHVIIPTPEGNEQIADAAVMDDYSYSKGMPVVYLLHGGYGNSSSWVRFSSIERYVQSHRCVAVMASVNNSFYHDMAHGERFFTFMTEELLSYIHNLFPASRRREDTFVAGFSMGGYGAWYLALSRPDLFSKAASMSGVMDIAACYEESVAGKLEVPFLWNDIFKDPSKLRGSTSDLFYLYQKCMENKTLPELYHACGTEDFLFTMNEKAHARLKAMGADVVYKVTQDAGHNWEYWDNQIKDVLNWMFNQ